MHFLKYYIWENTFLIIMETCLPLPLPKKELHFMVNNAKDWAIAHGITMRTADQDNSSEVVNYAPFLLLPSPVPRQIFEQAKAVQADFNLLYHNVANDFDFLRDTLKNAIKSDPFTRKLWKIYETVYNEGVAQEFCLALNRNDFMMDCKEDSETTMENGNKRVKISGLKLRQIEFNTIASSFAGLETQVAKYHRYALDMHSTSDYDDRLPENGCLKGLANGLLSAWQLYGNKKAAILFLVETVNRNITDQRWIEFEIYEQNKQVKVLRKDFTECDDCNCCTLTDDKRLIVDGYEIAVVYFRAGYTPNNYPCEQDWDCRLRIERSKAIKCPTINYQLAGSKKVQQELCKPGCVERFIKNPATVAHIRDTFAAMYSMDMDAEGDKAVAMAIQNPNGFVVKPQREGGGNNFFGEDVKILLEKIKDSDERTAYILMERVHPISFQNYPIRAGSEVLLTEMVSEIGVFGVLLGTKNKVLKNIQCGHLMRTKSIETNEGGVAAGYALMDSPYLV